jgi:hypothetical protein
MFYKERNMSEYLSTLIEKVADVTRNEVSEVSCAPRLQNESLISIFEFIFNHESFSGISNFEKETVLEDLYIKMKGF